jgi:4-amino-4-deoxy-L-arabinose transferase-like glycosyltransferase
MSALFLIGVLTYLPYIGQNTHQASHEGRHAEIAREMWLTGDYAVPHLAGRIYYDKPPLFHWLVAASYTAFGHATFFAARLVSVLAAAMGAVALFVIGRLLYGRRAGFAAGLMLLSTLLYSQWAVMCRMDMVMTAALLWVAAFTALAARAEKSPARWGWIAAACVALAVATLSKGFVPLGVGLVFIAATWLSLGGRKWLIAPVLLLALGATAAAGFAWAEATTGTDFLKGFWTFQSGGTGPKHETSFDYYFTRFPLFLLPWSLWLPFALWDAAVAFRRDRSWSRALPATLLVFGVLGFSLSSNKRVHYLLPLVPFAALLVSEFIVRRLLERREDGAGKVIRWPLAAVLLAAPGSALGLLFIQEGRVAPAFAMVVVALAAVLGVSVYGLRCLAAGRHTRALLAAVIGMLLVSVSVPGAVAFFYWDPEPELAEAREIAAMVPEDAPIGTMEVGDTLSFELPTPPTGLASVDTAVRFASSPGRRCLIIKAEDAVGLVAVLDDRLESMTTVAYDDRHPMAVILTRPE